MTSAEKAMGQLRYYTGENFWEDVIEPLGINEEASQEYTGWNSSEAVVFEDCSGIEWSQADGMWELMQG